MRGTFSDELGPVIGFEDETGQTDATGSGLAALTEVALVSFRARGGMALILTDYGILQPSAGDGYITFSLRVNGKVRHPFGKLKSQTSSLKELTPIHVQVEQHDLVELWAANSHATSAFQCAARLVGAYRDYRHVA